MPSLPCAGIPQPILTERIQLGVYAPVASPHDSVEITRDYFRVYDRFTRVLFAIIPDPLVDISSHIVESHRFLLTNWVGMRPTIFLMPSDFIYVVASCVFKVLIAPSTILPLGSVWAIDTLSHSSYTSHLDR